VVHFRARTWLFSQKYGKYGKNTRIRAQCSAGLLVSLTCRPKHSTNHVYFIYIGGLLPVFTLFHHGDVAHPPAPPAGGVARAVWWGGGGVVMKTAMATFLVDGWLLATRRGATQHKPSHPRPLPWARADFCGYVAHPPARHLPAASHGPYGGVAVGW
jgi:hypothetical protein